jgi:hypothetical protein
MTTWSRPVAPGGAVRVLACLALAAGIVSPTVVGAGAAPPALQRYEDPDKQFTIEYPRGWHVKHFPSGATYFYLDDPEEGTSFLLSSGSLKGEMDAVQALKAIATEVRKKYPDFKLVAQRQRPMQGNANGTIVQAAAVWTNAKKAPMKGWGNLGVIKQVGQGKTVFSYMGYQAPTRDFDQVEPVFDRMIRSFRPGKK